MEASFSIAFVIWEAAEKKARDQQVKIADLERRLEDSACLKEKVTNEAEGKLQAALEIAKEEKEAALKKVEEEKGVALVEVDLNKIRSMGQACLEGVKDLKESTEGKAWYEEAGTVALAEAVQDTINYTNSRAPSVDWMEFSLFIELESFSSDDEGEVSGGSEVSYGQ